MQVKYGIMAYESIAFFPKEGFRFDFGANECLIVEPVKKTLSEFRGEHWAEWLGSIAWEEFAQGTVQIQVWRQSKEPEVINQENNDITNTLWRFSRALMLCGLLRPPFNKPRSVTGLGQIQNGVLRPTDIRTTGKGPNWVDPLYLQNDEYTRSPAWTTVAQNPPWHYDNQFFETWKAIYNQLTPIESDAKNHHLLNLSLYAFQQALAEPVLDFSFPNFVRSVETLVTLSEKQGRGLFAKRARRFLPQAQALAYSLDEKRIGTILKESYGLRSDCVHGKPFGWGLGSRRNAFLEKDAAVYSYVMETLARHTIRAALGDSSFVAVAKDRSQLEAYWNKLEPPQP